MKFAPFDDVAPDIVAAACAPLAMAGGGAVGKPEGIMPVTGRVTGALAKFVLKVEKPMRITLKYDILLAADRPSGKVENGHVR